MIQYNDLILCRGVCCVEAAATVNSPQIPNAKRRVEIYDALRGIAIIYMIFYHTFYDLMMFGFDWAVPIFESQRIVVTFDQGLFIVLSGICCSYSRNNPLRGAKLLGIALLFTIVTVFVDYRAPITFGILHLLSFSMLIFSACEKVIRKLPPILFAVICSLIYAFTYNVRNGFFGFKGFNIPVPEMLTYRSRLFIIGFTDGTYSALDYFPLLPYLFLFLAGVFLGIWLIKRNLPEFAYKKVPFLGFLGKHSLFIYVVHQPVIYGLLYIAAVITNRI